ncbi:P-loop ATPase, Sll1717 family [Sulfitobacter sp. JB4-11]|uniref:P-loop ATPase, Sll1717 family n=1 Tax=Sulfitobacter rhodophyticola TaxID=3238304 RepID=UPI003513E6C8
MTKNPIIQNGASIGQLSAEADDEFLFECFFDHPIVAEVRSPQSPKMIILGSTGIGKTAALRMIEKLEERVYSVELDELSLNYISNSNVISFLTELGVPMDHFFQALWKHVICVEYIKLRYAIKSEDSSKRWFGNLKDAFSGDGAKKRALAYLEKWEGKFWISVDETVKEITETLEKAIEANFTTELEKFALDAGFVRKLGQEKKTQLVQRVKSVVDADLLTELAQVIRLLSAYDSNGQASHYVLIDKLDENWIGDNVKFSLIRSLIEALKSMRKIRNLKVVVALRADLMEKVIEETKEDGFQSEKYEDYFARISWTPEQLRTLVNDRINFLYRRKYTKQNVFFDDIMPPVINKVKTFPFLIERTLLRPRDIITFVNLCFAQGAEKTEISKSDVLKAELIYSTNRYDAMVDEWRPVYPAIEPCLKVLRERRESFLLSELNTSRFADTLLEELVADRRYEKDPLFQLVDNSVTSGSDIHVFTLVQSLMVRLHLVGAIGVNTSPQQPFQWFYKTHRRIAPTVLTSSSKVRIHPMLQAALATIR